MKRALLYVAVCLIVLAPACKSLLDPDEPTAPTANVVMIEGPILEDYSSFFIVKGRVQNKGTAAAKFGKITIYIRSVSGGLIAQDWSYLDDTDLQPNETSPFGVLISDDNHSIRNQMDFSKTTWEIKWD